VEHDVVGLGAVDVVLEYAEVLDDRGVKSGCPVVEFLGQPRPEQAPRCSTPRLSRGIV
jgi:hypothetical protein